MIAPQLIACLAFAATTIAGGDAAHDVNTGAADATLVRLDALVRDHFHSPVPLDQTGWDVLDLRDGWGGVPPEFVSIFDTRVPVLVTRTRAGDEHRFDGQIRVPAAVLINGGTRSGKEVLARAISHHGLATLVGERTAGAMRPGTVFCLPDRALLYLAVGTTTVDGDEFEGIGLDPDVPVPYDPRYAAGADPQLEAAIRILLKRVQP